MRFLALVGLALLTCGHAKPAPRLIPSPTLGATSWSPPDLSTIWQEAEDCSLKQGDSTRIKWFTKPGNSFVYRQGDGKPGYANGVWIPPDTIVIAVEYATTAWLLKHEIIHFLLQRGHSEEQRRVLWGVFCSATRGFIPQDPGYRP